jgi:hypothetical protein
MRIATIALLMLAGCGGGTPNPTHLDLSHAVEDMADVSAEDLASPDLAPPADLTPAPDLWLPPDLWMCVPQNGNCGFDPDCCKGVCGFPPSGVQGHTVCCIPNGGFCTNADTCCFVLQGFNVPGDCVNGRCLARF